MPCRRRARRTASACGSRTAGRPRPATRQTVAVRAPPLAPPDGAVRLLAMLAPRETKVPPASAGAECHRILDAQVLVNLQRRVGAVQGVEVDAADAVVEQVPALLC